MDDLIYRQAMHDKVIARYPDSDVTQYSVGYADAINDVLKDVRYMPSAQPEEVIPHRNYKYLSDYWCECGWHLGKKGEVKYCAECGRKVNWDG